MLVLLSPWLHRDFLGILACFVPGALVGRLVEININARVLRREVTRAVLQCEQADQSEAPRLPPSQA